MPRKQSVKNYLNMSSKQISKLSDKELRQAITVMDSAANKRIKRVYSAGLSSGKIDRQLENGKFSVKGIDTRAGLENAFINVKQFLESQTTSVSGIKRQQQRTFKNLAKIVNRELPKGEKIRTSAITSNDDKELQKISGLIWSQVDKLAENKALGITKSERYKIAAHAYNVVTRKSRPVRTKRGLFKNLQKYYNKVYEESLQDKDLGKLTPEEEKIASMYTNIT